MAEYFKRLTYETFEKTLRPFCKGTIEVVNSLGTTVKKNITAQYLDSKILLVSGLDQDEVTQFEEGDGLKSTGIGKDSLSAFRNGGKISPWITAAYMSKNRGELEKMVSLHFEGELMPFLQNNRSRDARRSIYGIILGDKEIPQRELATLKKSFTEDSDHLFLAKSFIFAMIRDSLVNDEKPANSAIAQVLKDIKATGNSTLLDGLLDLIHQYILIGPEKYSGALLSPEDIIKFVIGVLPVAIQVLDERQLDKFIQIRLWTLSYEINSEHMTGIADALNELFKKYGYSFKRLEFNEIRWHAEPHELDIVFKETIEDSSTGEEINVEKETVEDSSTGEEINGEKETVEDSSTDKKINKEDKKEPRIRWSRVFKRVWDIYRDPTALDYYQSSSNEEPVNRLEYPEDYDLWDEDYY